MLIGIGKPRDGGNSLPCDLVIGAAAVLHNVLGGAQYTAQKHSGYEPNHPGKPRSVGAYLRIGRQEQLSVAVEDRGAQILAHRTQGQGTRGCNICPILFGSIRSGFGR
jgi:hypothetical protein